MQANLVAPSIGEVIPLRRVKGDRFETSTAAIMGNCFRSKNMHGGMSHSSTREPLLRDTEREAVSSLLQYLEQGGEG